MASKDFLVPIAGVTKGSIAEELGIRAGDILVSINGQHPQDVIALRYLTSDEEVTLHVRTPHDEEYMYEIEKDYDEDIGLEFHSATFDGIHRCQNKCIFCFVDQMPPQLRPTLYVKDDDYRLSFLEGNFVTLTNLGEDDFDRIISQRLSPLYVSIHTVDPHLRRRLMGNKRAGLLRKLLDRLVAAGIQFHGQVVLAPGFNDGFYLEETIATMANYWPNALSLAIVPVGLTAHRFQLTPLQTFSREQAAQVIRWVGDWQKNFRFQFQSTFVYLADEFYVTVGQEVPAVEDYDDFPQLENGVGLIRLFLEELKGCSWPQSLPEAVQMTLATGVSAADTVQRLADRLNAIGNVTAQVAVIPNHFFGNQVTVAGLITGSDLLNHLQDWSLGDVLFIPAAMLQAGAEVFLDNVTVAHVAGELGVNIMGVTGPAQIAEYLGRMVTEHG